MRGFLRHALPASIAVLALGALTAAGAGHGEPDATMTAPYEGAEQGWTACSPTLFPVRCSADGWGDAASGHISSRASVSSGAPVPVVLPDGSFQRPVGWTGVGSAMVHVRHRSEQPLNGVRYVATVAADVAAEASSEYGIAGTYTDLVFGAVVEGVSGCGGETVVHLEPGPSTVEVPLTLQGSQCDQPFTDVRLSVRPAAQAGIVSETVVSALPIPSTEVCVVFLCVGTPGSTIYDVVIVQARAAASIDVDVLRVDAYLPA